MLRKFPISIALITVAFKFANAAPLELDDRKLLYAFNLATYTGTHYSGYHHPLPDEFGISTDHPDGACLCKNLDLSIGNHLHSFKFDPIMDPKHMELFWYYGYHCERIIKHPKYEGPHSVPVTPKNVPWASSFKVCHYGNK
ncbi:hypothetical protein BJ138DRAFT_130670 [Hygrophoropsis aurantiaca]|uniref:Uncharacterized protein n=1 Tax=Hygrophoropsis aurantiaca TaxID=72124 RepID=A0ACB8AC70_9AGAM|nr:hypothetical protein BJ138DRAFT_130670 [Hygrophoropsis aurantiaca]